MEPVDMNWLTGIADGDQDFIGVLASAFAQDADLRFGDIQAAIDAEDAEQLRITAHTLKGSAGNIGAREVAHISQDLENIGKAGSVKGANEHMSKLREAIDRARLFLSNRGLI